VAGNLKGEIAELIGGAPAGVGQLEVADQGVKFSGDVSRRAVLVRQELT